MRTHALWRPRVGRLKLSSGRGQELLARKSRRGDAAHRCGAKPKQDARPGAVLRQARAWSQQRTLVACC